MKYELKCEIGKQMTSHYQYCSEAYIEEKDIEDERKRTETRSAIPRFAEWFGF